MSHVIEAPTTATIEVEGVTAILTAISHGADSRQEHIEDILFEVVWAIVGPAYGATPDGTPDSVGDAATDQSRRIATTAAQAVEGILRLLTASRIG